MKERVIAELTVVPLGTASPSVSRYVAACLEPLKNAHDVRFQITPMGTVLEGPLERVMDLAIKMHEVPFGMGALRVVTTIKIDDRRDRMPRMEDKVAAVKRS
jgi:uncharacterized protein (TIGR00106 family)